ncbi:MAG TPA: SDR family NAD(P)-dependent oxidoreductase [Candidatus Thermoplasmatota archaeon]|nr:SDR family NAD(P)-dependent oxidoreductase [Candidatus Thermoplasmatota archaeon]
MGVDFTKLTVAITGASSGIGAATAVELAGRGAAVALGARREDRLKAVADECRRMGARGVLVRRVDVESWKDLEKFAADTETRLGAANVVIANAGFGNLGNTLDVDPKDVESLLRTNVVGAIWTVQAFGPQLERTKGHAIVVGSVVSKVAVPYASIYSGTKWALRGWTRGARPELESRGIRLTLFNPGYVRTEFFEHRAMGGKDVARWNPARGMTAASVAKRMMRAIRRRPAEMEMTALSRFGIPFYRLMPITAPRIMARIIRKRADERFAKKEV